MDQLWRERACQPPWPAEHEGTRVEPAVRTASATTSSPGRRTPRALQFHRQWVATAWASSQHHSILVRQSHGNNLINGAHLDYFSLFVHCCRRPTPHSAARIRLLLRRDAGTAVRRGRGRRRGLSGPPHWHPCPNSCGTYQHLAVPEQSRLWIKVRYSQENTLSTNS